MKKTEIIERKKELANLCQELPELTAAIVFHVGAKLSQSAAKELETTLNCRGVQAEVVIKAHNVVIQPK